MKIKFTVFLFFAIIITIAVTALKAQNVNDVVYLKNGLVLSGVITSGNQDGDFIMKLNNGSTVKSNFGNVDKFTENGENMFIPKTIGNSVSLEPLSGFLFFGPALELDFKIERATTIGAELRWAAMGMMYPGMLYSSLDLSMSDIDKSTMAAGISVKHFFGRIERKFRFYAGGLAEYGWASFSKTYDYNRGDGKHEYFDVMLNAGVRLRDNSGLFINFGAFAGYYSDINREYTYTDPDYYLYGTKLTNKGDGFIGMVELRFGIEF